MSYPLDSDVQEDVRTFPMYQRLRKTNPYAYYSLNTQKQMQSDLRNYGSLTFFEQDPDNIPDPNEPKHSIDLPKALAEADGRQDAIACSRNVVNSSSLISPLAIWNSEWPVFNLTWP